MVRKAFLMRVFPEAQEEYARRHRPIWPELEVVLRAHGVRSYSIHLDTVTGFLFGYAEVESQEQWDAIGRTEVCQRWWAHMVGLMETLPDHRPWSRDLKEVFRIE